MNARDRLIMLRVRAHYYVWLAFTAVPNPFATSRYKQTKIALDALAGGL